MDLSIDLELMIRYGLFDNQPEYAERIMDRLDALSELTNVLEMGEC
jgi:hypothetical protein